MKEINIKINKEFIERCVYQENWGSISLDEEELKGNIGKYIKENSESILREVIRDVMLEIVKKDLRKEVKEKVKSFIIGMADTELYYRDEFRAFLVDISKDNRKLIDEKIRAFLNNDDKFSQRLSDAIGYDFNGRIFKAIQEGKLD